MTPKLCKDCEHIGYSRWAGPCCLSPHRPTDLVEGVLSALLAPRSGAVRVRAARMASITSRAASLGSKEDAATPRCRRSHERQVLQGVNRIWSFTPLGVQH